MSSGKPLETTSARPRLNAEWHAQHRMPKNPSLEERILWHQAHEKACGCRSMPVSIREAIARGKRRS